MKASGAGGGSRERGLFMEALQIGDVGARREWLLEQCGEDAGLLASVESLLENHVEDEFLESPVVDAADVRRRVVAAGGAAVFGSGVMVGRYRLGRVIGEGGCGVVFQADQVEPVRREVALKLLKPGMDSTAILARFGLERQALAMMDHPNIARVLDAGATDAGYPFFVMELVRGLRITDHCERDRLTVRDRVELFIQVCRAVEHAHQKGIIHRDLKPSNILVAEEEGRAVPKVIDFGVAKLIEGAAGPSEVTMMGEGVLGTPAYMSPEQLGRGDAQVDTRSDVYSLGVLLYEVLCGGTPFSGESQLALARSGWSGDPVGQVPSRPSTRLIGLGVEELAVRAGRCGVEGATLVRMVRGDLDAIVMKALEPERERRYATAGEFAEDLRRHLEYETIRARPAGTIDWMGRWVRRHRVAFSATVLVGLSALVGFVLLLWQFVEKGTALSRAEASEVQERYLRMRLQEANADEVRLRELAESRGLEARQHAYAADMNLAQHALSVNNLGRARALLDRHRPTFANEDLRGWEWRYLWQFCQSQALYTLCQRPDEVAQLVASDDGRWLVICETRGCVTLWDLGGRRMERELQGSGVQARAAFSSDSRWLAYSARGRVRIREMTGEQKEHELPWHGICSALRFDTEGSRLLVLGIDGRLMIHELSKPEATRETRLAVRHAFMPVADISPDLERVVCSDPRGSVAVYRVSDGGEVFLARPGSSEARAAKFSPDGRTIGVSGGLIDSQIWILDAMDGHVLRNLGGHNAWVGSLAFWRDGRRMASASADQTIRVWELEQPGRVDVLRGHRLEVWSLALSRAGELLFSGSKDGTVCAWDPKGQPGGGWPVALPVRARDWWFSTNSAELQVAGERGEVVRWSLGTNAASVTRIEGELVQLTAEEIKRRRGASRAYGMGPDGTVVGKVGRSAGMPGWGVEEWVLSPDGEYVAAPSGSGVTRLRRVEQGGAVSELRGFLLGTHGVAFSPDSHRLAVGSNGAEAVKLFDVASQQELLTLEAKMVFVRTLAFSPDHRWLAASGWDGQIYLWRAPGFEEIAAREMEAR